jgi:hypothetical protein
MEAASTSETSVSFYKTTLRNNPEDSHLHTSCHENLKSEMSLNFIIRQATQTRSFELKWQL